MKFYEPKPSGKACPECGATMRVCVSPNSQGEVEHVYTCRACHFRTRKVNKAATKRYREELEKAK